MSSAVLGASEGFELGSIEQVLASPGSRGPWQVTVNFFDALAENAVLYWLGHVSDRWVEEDIQPPVRLPAGPGLIDRQYVG